MMKSFIVLVAIFSLVQSNPLPQATQFLPYAFGFTTADGMSRQEQGHNGVVSGSYSYTDPNGDLRQVKYTADAHGFRPEGDIGVDRRTAEAAAALAALAPKEPGSSGPGTIHAPAPVPTAHWSSASASHSVAPFQAYNSFEKLMAPPTAFHGSSASWSNGFPQGHLVNNLAGSVGSYQVDTPTHKIWVKY